VRRWRGAEAPLGQGPVPAQIRRARAVWPLPRRQRAVQQPWPQVALQTPAWVAPPTRHLVARAVARPRRAMQLVLAQAVPLVLAGPPRRARFVLPARRVAWFPWPQGTQAAPPLFVDGPRRRPQRSFAALKRARAVAPPWPQVTFPLLVEGPHRRQQRSFAVAKRSRLAVPPWPQGTQTPLLWVSGPARRPLARWGPPRGRLGSRTTPPGQAWAAPQVRPRARGAVGPVRRRLAQPPWPQVTIAPPLWIPWNWRRKLSRWVPYRRRPLLWWRVPDQVIVPPPSVVERSSGRRSALVMSGERALEVWGGARPVAGRSGQRPGTGRTGYRPDGTQDGRRRAR